MAFSNILPLTGLLLLGSFFHSFRPTHFTRKILNGNSTSYNGTDKELILASYQVSTSSKTEKERDDQAESHSTLRDSWDIPKSEAVKGTHEDPPVNEIEHHHQDSSTDKIKQDGLEHTATEETAKTEESMDKSPHVPWVEFGMKRRRNVRKKIIEFFRPRLNFWPMDMFGSPGSSKRLVKSSDSADDGMALWKSTADWKRDVIKPTSRKQRTIPLARVAPVQAMSQGIPYRIEIESTFMKLKSHGHRNKTESHDILAGKNLHRHGKDATLFVFDRNNDARATEMQVTVSTDKIMLWNLLETAFLVLLAFTSYLLLKLIGQILDRLGSMVRPYRRLKLPLSVEKI